MHRLLDLALLPARAAIGLAALPQHLQATVAELRAVRGELVAARGEAQALRGDARALVTRADRAIAQMGQLVDLSPHLLDTAVTAAEDLEVGLEELQRARAALADVAGHLPPIAEAAEGAAAAARKLGRVD